MMYEKIDIWKRNEPSHAIRFQCLRRLADNKYAVQNADYFRTKENKNRINESDFQFVELFLEEDPDIRCLWFSSLEEAIFEHEREFLTMPGAGK